ncbi:hypothetical protein AVEN_54422-1 [Araneus ventricosus]|uniref:Uncharacterized protein n=1 Tax=Araneus ventricosus TaxID=182803 RepID=A0A4Y2DBD0_ARAVE|nr:hypothetical protein AVEN_54422-1 [Araneus ventricosus]
MRMREHAIAAFGNGPHSIIDRLRSDDIQAAIRIARARSSVPSKKGVPAPNGQLQSVNSENVPKSEKQEPPTQIPCDTIKVIPIIPPPQVNKKLTITLQKMYDRQETIQDIGNDAEIKLLRIT